MHELIGALSHPLIAVDQNGVVTDCNDAAVSYLGGSAETAAGNALWESVHPDDVADLRHAIARTFETRHPRNLRFRVQDPGGRWCTLDAIVELIGSVASVSALDVTPESAPPDDETSRHRGALETLGLVTGGISHDFANLMMVIAGESARVIDGLGTESPLTRHVDTIRSAADRAAAMVRHLLSVSKPQSDSAAVLDLRDVVEGMTDIIQRLAGERIAVHVSQPAELWPVYAHRVQIERMLLNLSANARDAMPDGGRLTISTRDVRGARPTGAAVAVDAVAIDVTDTGIGMSEDTLTRAFEPFFTTKETAGTGLGLATVKAAVDDAGGWTSIESAPGRGTTVTILLPRVEADADAASRVQPSAVGGTETIVVIEDEESVLSVVRDMLESGGYRVHAAHSSASLDAFVAAYDGTVDLLLTDVVLPNASGLALAERMRLRYPGLPVLFMSGYAEPAFADGREGSIGSHFIAKPFDRQKLLRAVRRAIDSVSLADDHVLREPAAG